MMAGNELPPLQPQPLALPSALLLDTDSRGGDDDDSDSLLYHYPETAPHAELSHKLKGMLLAIRGVAASIVGQKVHLVTMEHFESEQTFKIGYVHLSGTLLAMLLPVKLPDFLVQSLAADCAQLLQFALGPPEGWWGEEAGEGARGEGTGGSPEKRSWVGRVQRRQYEPKLMNDWIKAKLDMILRCYFYEIRSREWLHAHLVPAFELGVPYAAVPPDLQLRALELLTNVEVAAPPADEQLASPAQQFKFSKSSCLIHDGKLVASHMEIRETKEVWRMCWALSLYQRTTEHPAVVLLQDAYFSDPKPAEGTGLSRAVSLESPGQLAGSPLEGRPGGAEPRTGRRVALLIVGMGVDIVVVMLTPVGAAVAEDLTGSFLFDVVTHELVQFQEAEFGALHKLLGPNHDDSGLEIQRMSSTGVSPSGKGAAHAPESLILHHVSYNGVNGVLLATEPPPGELASNLAGDFLATAFHLHHLFSRLRRAVWGKPAHDAAGDDSPTDTSPFTPFSPFSNSPGPQWDQLGTPTSTLRSAKDAPFTLSLSHLITAAGSLRDGQAQRLGRADPTPFTLHRELAPLLGATEIRVALRRTDLAGMLPRGLAERQVAWWVTGRVDPSGRELFMCHAQDVPLSAVDMAFQISFGTFC
eukprot:jgi/Tetstr1/448038/TSEL_035339.t1